MDYCAAVEQFHDALMAVDGKYLALAVSCAGFRLRNGTARTITCAGFLRRLDLMHQ